MDDEPFGSAVQQRSGTDFSSAYFSEELDSDGNGRRSYIPNDIRGYRIRVESS
jgi:hypothetical protein